MDADIDGDGAVSVADILLLLAAFGEECWVEVAASGSLAVGAAADYIWP